MCILFKKKKKSKKSFNYLPFAAFISLEDYSQMLNSKAPYSSSKRIMTERWFHLFDVFIKKKGYFQVWKEYYVILG